MRHLTNTVLKSLQNDDCCNKRDKDNFILVSSPDNKIKIIMSLSNSQLILYIN